MGKGTISSESGKGRYTVSLDYGTDIADAQLEKLNARKDGLENYIAQQEVYITELESNRDAANFNLRVAISTYNASEMADEDKERLDKYQISAIAAGQSLSEARITLSLSKADLANVVARLAKLNALSLSESRSVWCADYTESATGDVAMIEIDGEQPLALIAPAAPASVASDGHMQARDVMSAEQAFLNAAILPGWQKFSPTYRIGTITAINYGNDTCSVDLDAATSSAQNLDINQSSSLSDVPIEYMTCDAKAFTVADEVVVQFLGQNWSTPKVIGFKDNPKSCAPKELFFIIELADERVTTPGTPLGAKYKGIPAEGYYSEESPPGYETSGETIGSDWAYDVNVSDPTGGYNYDPGTENRVTDVLRVRYDVVWAKESEFDEYFTSPADIGSTVEVTSEADYVDLVTDYDGGGCYMESGASVPYIRKDPWWTSPSSGTAPWYWDSIDGNRYYVYDPEVEIYYGSPPATEHYQFQAWTGQNWDNNAGYTANDLDHADSWIRALYSPPTAITVEVDGIEHTYNLLRMGGAPRALDDDRSIPPVSPPSLGGTSSYTTNAERRIAVWYERADTP